MGKVIIQNHTTKHPITMIGEQAGICYGTDVSDPEKNFKRGMRCISDGHGRTLEFPDVYAVISGYSARVIREWYTHIGGAPTRLQESTRYVKYDDYGVITPDSVTKNPVALERYKKAVDIIKDTYIFLVKEQDIPVEDAANLLNLGMYTKMVDKRNARNLLDMAANRTCFRAYWEYRELFNDYLKALREYSEEWAILIDKFFVTKCEQLGYCPESHGCGKYLKKVRD